VKLATRACPVGRPTDVAGWARKLDTAVAEAAWAGAELLLFAEYAAMEPAFGPAPDIQGEILRAASLGPALLAAAVVVARRHKIWLMPGTMPWSVEHRTVNRAHLIAPDGRVAHQDKHVMTRFEAEQWDMAPGPPPSIFTTDWGLVGIATCFDSEFPTVVRAQVEAGAWLILVPSCTDTRHGDMRIRIAARARAMENQCFVAVAPTVGAAPWCAAFDTNFGRAAIYGPVDRGFHDTGVVVEGAVDAPGWVFADLDPASIEAVRRNGAVRNHLGWPAAIPPCPVVEPA